MARSKTKPKTRERITTFKSNLGKMCVEAVLLAAAFILAFLLRTGRIEKDYYLTILIMVPLVVVWKIAVFHYIGCYRGIWRYSSLTDLETLIRGSVIAGAGILAVSFLLDPRFAPPRSVPLIDLGLTVLLSGGLRMGVRIYYESAGNDIDRKRLPSRLMGGWIRHNARRALIVGAGDAGEMIVREMIRSPRMDYWPVGFIDDNPVKQGQSIHGVPVFGGRERIPDLVKELEVTNILIAIPTARGKQVREIIQYCRNTTASLQILPDLGQVAEGLVGLSDLRKVEVEDLLGRETTSLDLTLISSYLRGKRILVTGAGGSIGSELCRQILKFAPAEIQLMGRGENSIFEIHKELSVSTGFTRLIQIIGDVINKKKLEGIFAMHRPQIVFHAGADKHVPLMELNPDEAVMNNIVGTKNVLQVSNAHRVERVVCISTDKAVNPTSIMGCCKRVAELLIRSGMYQNTVPVAVRFGNVLGSRGSVIPHFQKQIDMGGPITVTHREIRRFFMTIPEASGLVIQAGAMGRAGEIFVLDMGEPIRIWDLATNMVRLAGLDPGVDVEIRETGLRPGEKLDEELLFHHEVRVGTEHPKIWCVKGDGVDEQKLIHGIEQLTQSAIRMDNEQIRRILARLVPEFGARPEKKGLTLISGGGI